MQPTGSPTIVIVEDDPDHAFFLLEAVKQHDAAIEAIHLSSSREAIRFLRHEGGYARAPRPSLVTLNIDPLHHDGLEVLRMIKTDDDLCDIPVVMICTSQSPEDHHAARLLHANSVLIKPIDYGEFRQMIEQCLTYWVRWEASENLAA